jgi:dihydropteroate synthase
VQNNGFYTNNTLNLKGSLMSLSPPKVMGILNVTPDSFYDGSRIANENDLINQAGRMIAEGAQFLDVGGYSTRPGAEVVTEADECARVLPAIKALSSEFPDTPVSIDTFRAGVARQAVEAGASIVNDVSGGEQDPTMFETVARLGVPYVLMHMRGNPQTMNTLSQYDDILKEMAAYFSKKIFELHEFGVKDIILDPGFGFAKTADQSFQVLQHLKYFSIFGLPVLAGLSRKSMIWRTLGAEPSGALNGTTALNTLALANGASILRVHDVREAMECIALTQRMNQQKLPLS